MTPALIFANGAPDDGAMVRRTLQNSPNAIIIAADGGAHVAQYFNLQPHVIIGDMDSITPQWLAQLQQGGAQVHRHPAHKDQTDLELALIYAQQNAYHPIRIFGALGNRFDQTLANITLLALPALQHSDVAILSGKQALRLLTQGTHTVNGHIGDTLSLIPFSGDVHGITTHNLQYPLQSETLPFGTSRGISNVLQNEKATITLDSGKLLIIHTLGKA